MEFLKELFGENSLSFEEFAEAAEKLGLKLADLSDGDYVCQEEHKIELKKAEEGIEELQKLYDALLLSISGEGGYEQKIAALEDELSLALSHSDNLHRELIHFRRRELSKKFGVADEFIDFALYDAFKFSDPSILNDDNNSDEEILKTWVANNSQFLAPHGNMPRLGGNPASASTSNADKIAAFFTLR